MTVRSIRQVNDDPSVLRQRARLVDASNVGEANLVATDLLDTMASQPLCVGLAANQIGSDLFVAVVASTDGDAGHPLVMVNPSVVQTSGKKDRKRESCMSVWGLTAEVERRYRVEVVFSDLELRESVRTFTGFVGRVVQHEIDHLNGVVYIDHVAEGQVRETEIFDPYTPEAE